MNKAQYIWVNSLIILFLSNGMDKNELILSKRLDDMDKQLLKKILLENQNEVQRYEVYPRSFQFEEFGNYVFVGIRRAGKSYLLYQRIQQLLSEGIGWDEILYLNFEDERLGDFKTEDFNLILEAHFEMYGKRPILFLDEVQNVDQWHKFARRMADTKYRVYITGSNAKMLSSEVYTTLGGRYLVINVFPYSFSEYLMVNGVSFDERSLMVTESKAKVLRLFTEYFHEGGFPEAALLPSKRNYLISAYQKIYLGDIAARNGITNTLGLKVMLKKMAESVKQPLSYNRIAAVVSSAGSKLSVTSAAKYVDFAIDAWLICRMTNIAAKLVEKESNCKYYFIDNGLLNTLLLDAETSLLENLVAVNLLRLYGAEDAVYFYNKGVEVDFYIPEVEWAVQVSYSLKDADTRNREVKALVKLAGVISCRRLSIITYDEEETIDEGGLTIEVKPVWKWLLQ